ncbi:MAG: hypothetical protein QUV06_07015 [Cyanobium sp. CZS 48M]|nr:hypothetical protein [Cyanobium sp. CZS48M]
MDWPLDNSASNPVPTPAPARRHLLYEPVKALKDYGYRWLLVQEHSVETLHGSGLCHEQHYTPPRDPHATTPG